MYFSDKVVAWPSVGTFFGGFGGSTGVEAVDESDDPELGSLRELTAMSVLAL
jgi:hypothetical protein